MARPRGPRGPVPSRWAAIVPTMARARRLAEGLGHSLSLFEVDDPATPLDSKIAECRRCGRLAVIEMNEAPYLFGNALRVGCHAVV